MLPVQGRLLAVKVEGAAEGMGTYGDATSALVDAGLVQPDLIAGMTQALISNQPRRPRPDGAKKASGPAGKIRVRERFTIHRPLAVADAWTVIGEATGLYVRQGRRCSVTTAVARNAAGERVATNLSTGLLSHVPDQSLSDTHEGLHFDDTPVPEPD